MPPKSCPPQREFHHTPGDTYVVTGVDKQGKRFRRESDNPHYAFAINIYRGSVWQVQGGRRKLIRRVWN